MKTFIQWADNQELPIPFETDFSEVNTDVKKAKKTTNENRARTGWSANYPPAYFSAQYPSKYVNPYKGTADLDAEIMKKK